MGVIEDLKGMIHGVGSSENLKPEPATPGIREFTTGAVRSSDADNVRYDLISPIALEEIAKTYKEGADRYGDHNWLKGMPVSDLLNHALRHVYLFLSGDRSEPHLPHAAWGLMAAIHSHKQWPHLNGNLLGEGCTPPVDTVKAEPPKDSGWPPASLLGDIKLEEPRPLPPGIVRYPDYDSISGGQGVQSPYWGIVQYGGADPAPSLGGKVPPAPFKDFWTGLDCLACTSSDPAPQGEAVAPPKCQGCLKHGDMIVCSGKNCTGGKNKADYWYDSPQREAAPESCSATPSLRLVLPPESKRQRHHIPVIEDALDDKGPFPVLYLSGPMSGIRDLNFPAFNKAAEELRQLGFPVLNPADFGQCAGMEWEDNLQRDLYILGCADIVVQLPGWDRSRGASLEYSTAVALGKGVTELHTLIPSEQSV